MKGAVCYEFGKPLVIEELEIDPPQAGEIKVKMAACAICHSDIHYVDGVWGGKLPAVYGHEAAGVVEDIGPGVTLAAPGDHVVISLIRSCGQCFFCMQGSPFLCETTFPLHRENRIHNREGQPILAALKTGAFAEYAIVHESQVVKVPDTMPWESASLLACGVITGLGAVVNTARVPSGSSVAVIGTGGVGLNTIQGARLSGAHPIIAIDLLESKLAAAETFGATHTLNATEEDLRARIRALTRQRGVDYAFITVGSAQAIEQGFTLLRRGGALVIVGMPAVGAKIQFEAIDIPDHNYRILGSNMGSTRLRVDIPKLVELYEQGRLMLDELITHRYALAEINEAMAAVKRGEVLRSVILF